MRRTLIIPFLLVSLCVWAEKVTPYFTTPEMPNALHYLPAPPQTNEMRYAYDTAQYQWGKSVRNTTLGWSTAFILCEIYPEAQDALLREGFEYGQSRVIAGFHWQSDVDAARVVASAAFARLHTSKAYLKQLKKAQKEFRCKKR